MSQPGGSSFGPLALVGGGEWSTGCDFDAWLLEASGGDEVTVLPTASAYERPEGVIEAATAWFSGLGGRVRELRVLTRADAQDEELAGTVASSSFVYLSAGSALHLRSVLKSSRLWEALLDAWRSGAVVAGSGAGAMVLTDPMVDPRGGALTVGLGMVQHMAVVPYFGTGSAEKVHRSIALAAPGLPVVGVPERSALIREADGTWRPAGASRVEVFVSGEPADLSALPS